MIQGLPADCRREVRKVKSDITFRFGNSGTLSAKHALLLPASGAKWVRVEIVPGNTPLLISNRLLRDLDAVIYVRRGMLCLGGGAEIPLRFDERGLSIVDLAAVLLAPRAVAHLIADIAPQADKVLHTSTLGKDLTFTHETTHNKANAPERQQDQSLPQQPTHQPSACATDFISQPSLRDGHAGLAEQGSRQARRRCQPSTWKNHYRVQRIASWHRRPNDRLE